MAALGSMTQITHEADPSFLIDPRFMVGGQPCTACWQQIVGPVARVGTESHEACTTECLRQLGLSPGFTPLVD